MEKKQTPLMRQYWQIKNQHTDKVLLFRMGDFFEMFHEDAVLAAPILNIALTSRNKKSKDDTPMCGMPHHSIASPIAKLLSAGHKVAICDQVEDPKDAKGIVKRAVTRILSPGMVYDPETLDQLSANYICAADDQSMALLDCSTGEAFYYLSVDPLEKKRIRQILNPSEIVVSEKQQVAWRSDLIAQGLHVSRFDEIEKYLPLKYKSLPESMQRLIAYVSYMQGTEVLNILGPIQQRRLQSHLELSPTVVRHLELFSTYKGEKKGSLFFALNRCKTSSGARLLKRWLSFPLTDEEKIQKRQHQVSYWMKNQQDLKQIRTTFVSMGDVERRLGKISNPGCNARDLISLGQSLRIGMEAQSLNPFQKMDCVENYCLELVERIEKTIKQDPPLSVRDGGIIQKTLRADLDELIELSENSQELVRKLEAREKQKTGISSLKVRFNNVFGYYIEVTKLHSEKVPEDYRRKQTLTNAERYTTDELHRLEEKVVAAKSRRAELENEVFSELKKDILKSAADLLELSYKWSELDVFTALAWLALEQKYILPSFSKAGSIQLKNSRHPVIEQEVCKDFVPNDVVIDQGECLLLTGPNMAGKSTIMRQIAIISILAQAGAPVPAEVAIVPLFDRIFTRIGASDFLNEGLSTFMVEMKETADMLKQASHKSLVILDEIGRGTSTYDGMSLAQSILEYLVSERKCMTLFATHFHELTKLSSQFPQIKNAHMSIREQKSEIIFLHTLVQGSANRSYGIEVAKLAGLPSWVTQRAQKLLKKFEFGQVNHGQMSLMEAGPEVSSPGIDEDTLELIKNLKSFEVQSMTPLEALNQLAKIQSEAQKI